MKVIAIGDIHGRTAWQKIVTGNEYDKVVFVGDYFDSHDNIPGPIQLGNFRNILKFKRQNPTKVVLLIGNHDFQYLKVTNQEYSGYQPWQKWDISDVLQPAVDNGEVVACFVADSVMYTHAGIGKTWLTHVFGEGINTTNIDLNVLQSAINTTLLVTPKTFEFTSGKNHSMYGDDICQTPIWIRPGSLMVDKIDGVKQVVGHTYSDTIKIEEGIAFIDALGSGQYLTIVDGEMSTNSI